MRKIAYLSIVLSVSTLGCFVSRKETVREVPVGPTTTIERHSSTVETVPGATDVNVLHRQTTVESSY